VNVELVLSSHNCGVDEKRDRVALRRLAVRALEESARAPRRVEIVRRPRRTQERILNSNDPPRRGEDRVVQQRRTQDDCTEFLAAGKIDLEARKRRSSQLIVSHARAHDLPQRRPMELHRIGRERRRHGQDGNHCKNPHCLRAARHGFVLRIALKPSHERSCALRINLA
jgi:hypothetical protein